MDAPDLVVPVRTGKANPQLRYALRSWEAHLPHGRVWIVGYRPAWMRNVQHIPSSQHGTKYANTTAAVRAACSHPDVSQTFLLCNDDMFVMAPQPDGMPVLHRGRVADLEEVYVRRTSGRYLDGMRKTRDLLVSLGHNDPLSYELHVPMPVDKRGMLKALDVGRHLDAVHKRTLYGNLAGIGGDEIRDVKVLNRSPRFDKTSPFLSTLPDSFTNGSVGTHIRRAFPSPSRYEGGGHR